MKIAKQKEKLAAMQAKKKEWSTVRGAASLAHAAPRAKFNGKYT